MTTKLTILVIILQKIRQLCDACPCKCVPSKTLQHTANNARMHALVEKRYRRCGRYNVSNWRLEFPDQTGLMWRQGTKLKQYLVSDHMYLGHSTHQFDNLN